MVKCVFPELVVSATTLGGSSATGNGPGNFVQEIDDIDGQSSSLFRPGCFPVDEIESPFATGVDDDQVIGPAGLSGPRLPLASFLLLGAQHQSAEPGGEIAVSEVLGGPAGLAAARGSEDTDAGQRVGQPEGVPAPPVAQNRPRMKFRQFRSRHHVASMSLHYSIRNGPDESYKKTEESSEMV